MSCMWIKDGFHFKFNSAQVSWLPTELPTISILESSGLPTELLTELPTVPIYVSSGQPNLHGKIPMGSPWAPHSTAHWAEYCFHIWKKLATQFVWQNYHGQPTPLPTELPTFSYLEVVGCPLSCPLSHIVSSWLPTELLTVSL